MRWLIMKILKYSYKESYLPAEEKASKNQLKRKQVRKKASKK